MFLGLHSPSIYYSEWQGFHMSALSSEVAGEARRRGQDKSVAGARLGGDPPEDASPSPRSSLLFFLHSWRASPPASLSSRTSPSSRFHTHAVAPPLLQEERVAAMSCWVTGRDDATGGVDR